MPAPVFNPVIRISMLRLWTVKGVHAGSTSLCASPLPEAFARDFSFTSSRAYSHASGRLLPGPLGAIRGDASAPSHSRLKRVGGSVTALLSPPSHLVLRSLHLTLFVSRQRPRRCFQPWVCHGQWDQGQAASKLMFSSLFLNRPGVLHCRGGQNCRCPFL